MGVIVIVFVKKKKEKKEYFGNVVVLNVKYDRCVFCVL